MPISLTEKLRIYKASLAKYEAEGDTDRAEVQRRLIARMERELANSD